MFNRKIIDMQRIQKARDASQILSRINPSAFPNPAIVFDIDDTLIDSESGSVIIPIRQLYDYAKALGYTLFIITARDPIHRDYTRLQLNDKNITGYADMYMVPYHDRKQKGEKKAIFRRGIENMGYQVVMNIGDDPTDFTNGHYLISIKLPSRNYHS